MDRATSEIANSVELRRVIDLTIKETGDALVTQSNAVEDAFNQRIAECAAAKKGSEQDLAEVRAGGDVPAGLALRTPLRCSLIAPATVTCPADPAGDFLAEAGDQAAGR